MLISMSFFSYFVEIFHGMTGDGILCQAHKKWTDELSSSGDKWILHDNMDSIDMI